MILNITLEKSLLVQKILEGKTIKAIIGKELEKVQAHTNRVSSRRVSDLLKENFRNKYIQRTKYIANGITSTPGGEIFSKTDLTILETGGKLSGSKAIPVSPHGARISKERKVSRRYGRRVIAKSRGKGIKKKFAFRKYPRGKNVYGGLYDKGQPTTDPKTIDRKLSLADASNKYYLADRLNKKDSVFYFKPKLLYTLSSYRMYKPGLGWFKTINKNIERIFYEELERKMKKTPILKDSFIK